MRDNIDKVQSADPTPDELEQERRELEETWRQPKGGLLAWLSNTDHKDLALRNIVTAFIFFAFAGILALVMRLQLARPDGKILGPDLYNQFFTTHGTSMMFLFAVPVMLAMGLYLVPLMVGTRGVPFPRLNAYGFYTYVIGGLFLYIGLILNMGPDAGWFAYVPLSGPEYGVGRRVDLWGQVVNLSEIAALVAAVQIIVCAMKFRAPGMSLNRIPLFVWSLVVTSFMTIFAMPIVMLISNLISVDRTPGLDTHFFNQAEGGDPLLWQHLFWFFGHPEVYIIFIPATGMVSTIITTFSRRKTFGYTALVLTMIATAFIGFGVWVHHMFATPLPQLGQSIFTASSMLIVIPNGVQIFCWIATLWLGRPECQDAADLRVRLLRHFHHWRADWCHACVGSTQSTVARHIFCRRASSLRLDRRCCISTVRRHLLLVPEIHGPHAKRKGRDSEFHPAVHWLQHGVLSDAHSGLNGMTRRIYTYIPETGWGDLNMLATVGAFVMALAVIAFVANIIYSLKLGPIAGDNPWGADTLEWSIPSPPPPYAFEHIPVVQGRHALWEKTENVPVVTGLYTRIREVLCTTIHDASPEHRLSFNGPSLYPLLLALVTGVAFIGLLFTQSAEVYGMIVSFPVLLAWFWSNSIEHRPPHSPEKDNPVFEADPEHEQ